MVDHRECFLYKELPVIPDNPVEDTWLIYSPYLNRKIKIKGKKEFENSTSNKLKDIDDNFYTPNYPLEKNPIRLELYISNINTNIKKAIIHSVNKCLENSNNNLLINIVSDNANTDIYNISEVISIINILTEDVVNTQIVLSSKNYINISIMESLKKFNISFHFDVENITPQDIFNVITKHSDNSNISIRLFVNKNTVYKIDDFVYKCIKYGIKKIYIEPAENKESKPIKEAFVLNLLRGIKLSIQNDTKLLNSAYNNSFPVNIMSSFNSEDRPEKCHKCFAKHMCMGKNDFQCYVAQNTIPSLIKCY